MNACIFYAKMIRLISNSISTDKINLSGFCKNYIKNKCLIKYHKFYGYFRKAQENHFFLLPPFCCFLFEFPLFF